MVFSRRYYIKESKGSKRWLLFLEGEDGPAKYYEYTTVKHDSV